MNSSTKIVVIKLKELISAALLVLLAIILIIFLIVAFSNKSDTKTTGTTKTAKYTAGVYSSTVTLNGNPVDIQVTVDANNINSIQMINVSDSVTTMYPLIQSSFDEISKKVCETGSTQNITYASESKYTATILLNAIDAALEKCTIK